MISILIGFATLLILLVIISIICYLFSVDGGDLIGFVLLILIICVICYPVGKIVISIFN